MSEPRKKDEFGFFQATQPEILKLNEKDDEYINEVKRKLLDALDLFVPHLFSYRQITQKIDYLTLISSLIYYGLTTVRGKQTLGEEYSSLMQISSKDYKYEGIPTHLGRRILYVLMICGGPFIVSKYLTICFNKMRDKALTDENRNSWKVFFFKRMPDFSEIVQNIYKLHLGVFFIKGVFYEISKRFSKIRYIFVKQPQNHNIHYSMIGQILLLQIALQFFQYFIIFVSDLFKRNKPKKLQKSAENLLLVEDNENQNVNENEICGLCYDKRKSPSVTPCGHLFCWECIVKNCVIKPECPQCRQYCPARKIIRLRNFN